MSRALRITVLAIGTWLGAMTVNAWAAVAAPVDVTFTDRSTRDLGPGEARPIKSALTNHLEELAKSGLGPGQHLQIDVVRLQPGGHLSFPRGEVNAVRVLTGRGDAPRIDLHYVLTSSDGVLREGDDSLTDANFLDHPVVRGADQPYPYEKRLLTDWFRQRFGSDRANGK